MATKLNTTKMQIPLFGHGLNSAGLLTWEPNVLGVFEEDPVIGNDGREYAVFTVADEDKNQSQWAGVYRISVFRLAADIPRVFTSLEDKYK